MRSMPKRRNGSPSKGSPVKAFQSNGLPDSRQVGKGKLQPTSLSFDNEISLTTQKQASIAQKPTAATQQPAAATQQPAPVTEKQAPVTNKPAPVTEKLAPVTEKPVAPT